VATKIRLQRIGAKKRAFYRIVVADKLRAPGSKVIEYLGTYDPHTDPPEVKLDLDLVDNWLSKGALPTEKTAVLIKKAREAQSETGSD
jgi:small subunit ribosomal protein S16